MKKAFTMLELVFVIVVIGILAATIIPNTKRNPLQEAAVQLASHLRYTQHLAMIDDKYNGNNDTWYKDRWQMIFASSTYTGGSDVWAYTIFSDTAGSSTTTRGDVDVLEVALNPENSNQLMTGGFSSTSELYYGNSNFKGMKSLNIGNKYGIIGSDAVKFSNSCDGSNGSSKRIAFDHLGRPMQGDHNSMTGPYNAYRQRLITSLCTITLSDGTESIDINIEPETGYVSIDFNP